MFFMQAEKGTLNNLVHVINPLTAELALRALIDFTLSNARRFYSSTGNPLAGKGLRGCHYLLCKVAGVKESI